MAESKGDLELARAISDLNIITSHLVTLAVNIMSWSSNHSAGHLKNAQYDFEEIKKQLDIIGEMQLDIIKRMEQFTGTRSE